MNKSKELERIKKRGSRDKSFNEIYRARKILIDRFKEKVFDSDDLQSLINVLTHHLVLDGYTQIRAFKVARQFFNPRNIDMYFTDLHHIANRLDFRLMTPWGMG